MGHQDLTLLYVKRELFLYCSPSCVFTIIQTPTKSVKWKFQLNLCSNKERIDPPKTNDLYKIKDQQKFDDVTRHIRQVMIGSRKNPICIPRNSVITMPGHTTKIYPKAVCLVKQAEHHNLPQGIVVNRCVTRLSQGLMREMFLIYHSCL